MKNRKAETFADSLIKKREKTRLLSLTNSGCRTERLGARQTLTNDRYRLRLILPIILLAIGAYGSAKLYASIPERGPVTKKARVYYVRSVAIRLVNLRPSFVVYGTTVAGRQLVLRSRVAGEVIETSPDLKEGGVVNKGEQLLRIEPFHFLGAVTEARTRIAETEASLSEIRASIAREDDTLKHAREQLSIARADLSRAQKLATRKNISTKIVDDRRAIASQRSQAVSGHGNSITILKSRIKQKEATLERLNWQLTQAQRHLQETALNAPFDGYVVNVSAQLGKMLNTNDGVATLIDKHWIEVRFALSKQQFARLLSEEEEVFGRKVVVRWHLGEKRLTYPATIERLAPTISAAKGGIEVIARIVNPSKPFPLRPGAFVEVEVPDKAYSKVARLPQSVLYGKDTVFIVKDGELVARNVEVIGWAEGDILVRGGLAFGDRVVISRLSSPLTGQRVEEI